MDKEFILRETTLEELPGILGLYPIAFPDEVLNPLVSALINGLAETLSIGAFSSEALAGHVIFTIIGGAGKDEDRAGALLGPLGVLPRFQKQGVGSALVKSGLERLSQRNVRQVFVLGDPGYYGLFGFKPEKHVLPPYELPLEWADAWQSLTLAKAQPLQAGRCVLPDEWMDRALWLP